MPDVVGKQLDVAKSDLKRARVNGDVEVIGGGVMGILKESNWLVCEQVPDAGNPVTDKPRLIVERSCTDNEPSPSPPPEPSATRTESPSTPAASPTVTGKVTDTTVEKLVDRINHNKLKNGQMYRVTGQLTDSERWGTGASGDYFVTLDTVEGSDLIIFIDEDLTLGWEGGQDVEMILETVPFTINGETTDWLRARSARIVS